MIAGTASLHMYSMASWSPSQSAPLTVSHICQRQSSSPILPSAAEMPPSPATVMLRVGKTFVTHPVLRPASARPHVDLRPAPPATSVTDSHRSGQAGDRCVACCQEYDRSQSTIIHHIPR